MTRLDLTPCRYHWVLMIVCNAGKVPADPSKIAKMKPQERPVMLLFDSMGMILTSPLLEVLEVQLA